MQPGAGQSATPLRWRRVFPGHEQELRNARYWLAGLLPDYPARADVLTIATELAANAVRHSASGWDGYFAVELSWLAWPATIRIAVADGGGPASPAGLAALSTLDRVPAGPGDPGTGPPGPLRPETGPLVAGLPGTGPLVAGLPGTGLPGAEALTESGRGLRLVRALALRAGMCGDERGRLVWADVWWDTGDQPEPGVPDGYRAALRDVQAVLAARYPEAAIWFGQATMHWWAMVGGPAGGLAGGLAGGPDSRLLTAASPLELARLLDLYRARQRLVRRPSRGRHGATGRRRATTGSRRASGPGPQPAAPGPRPVLARRGMSRREAGAAPFGMLGGPSGLPPGGRPRMPWMPGMPGGAGMPGGPRMPGGAGMPGGPGVDARPLAGAAAG